MLFFVCVCFFCFVVLFVFLCLLCACVCVCVCVCVSQTLFQREVRFSDERFYDFHDHHAGGHRKPIELHFHCIRLVLFRSFFFQLF